jgi:4-aminobutyrate aminotransferase-like enzyme
MAAKSEVVGEVRGRGLMLGIGLIGPDGEPEPGAVLRFMEACRRRGVLVGKGGLKANTIRYRCLSLLERRQRKRSASLRRRSKRPGRGRRCKAKPDLRDSM